jgi:hypothetical protein
MAKSRKVSSISKEFDGKEIQGKLIERSGLLGSKVKKEVFKFPSGGRHVEKTRTNKKGDVISRVSKDTKVNPFKKGGSTSDKKWIQKAINPAHKGFCTPMSKPTCTPKRAALARTFKKMAKNK